MTTIRPYFKERRESSHNGERSRLIRLALFHTCTTVFMLALPPPFHLSGTEPPEAVRVAASLTLQASIEDNRLTPERLQADFARSIQGCAAPDRRVFQAYCELRRRLADVSVAAHIQEQAPPRCYWSVDGFGPYDTPADHADLLRQQQQSSDSFRRCLPHLANMAPLWSLSAPVYSELNDAEFQLFSTVVSQGTIRSLACSGPGFSDQTARVLANVPQLRELRLTNTALTNSSLAYISAMYDLKSLAITENQFSGDAIANSIGHLNLEYLNVSETGMDDSGLSCVDEMSNLEILSLHRTRIVGEGLKHLKPLKKLRHLDLSQTLVDDDCVDHLSELASLRFLNVVMTRLSREAVERLRARLPSCDVKEVEVNVIR